MNDQRRTFRGRGGPTDGRLPKYNARRRKVNRQQQQQEINHGDDTKIDDVMNLQITHQNNEYDDEDFSVLEILHQDEVVDKESFVPNGDENRFVNSSGEINQSDEDEARENSLAVKGGDGKDTSNGNPQGGGDSLQKEIDHLMNRVKNNRASFSLSKDGLATLEAYQMNVLNAVKNCVNEWRGILGHHFGDMTPEIKRNAGQALFELLQQALQSGPLFGAKPGYFKRCGSEVATTVHAYLFQTIASKEDSLSLCFTEKQAAAVETWKASALKAAESSKPPSDSVIRRQQEANKSYSKKKKKFIS
eukprot:CAMPEP_0198139972 /NCGR_PEP_ID=MMETSP1443-20131203/3206_1 /TAXON_ID=186043 /ORGANISM="Entomoneis sp., Strain CCMP2396" /LENGTH=303 /DNA_ID=CAMNT_0043802267 /DNA_START=27 /DNA_END=938 /DNA_ORIENTATION=-